MTMHRIRLICLMAVLVFGALTPQFAQEPAKDSEISDQQSSLHDLMAAFIRTINTAEVSYHAEYGSYVSWQTLLGNREEQKTYLNGWLAQNILSTILPAGRQGPVQHAASSTAWSEHATECGN